MENYEGELRIEVCWSPWIKIVYIFPKAVVGSLSSQ